MLFSEPKIPQLIETPTVYRAEAVSVLFSEPKIPQFSGRGVPCRALGTVSVLFSEPKIPQFRSRPAIDNATELFQCSSASRKFLNIHYVVQQNGDTLFQCSSASRKFLNGSIEVNNNRVTASFSALQRAENSSTFPAQSPAPHRRCFSALQRAENSSTLSRGCGSRGR